MFCDKCGAALGNSSRFCPKCGAPVTGAPAPQGPSNYAQDPANYAPQSPAGYARGPQNVGQAPMGYAQGPAAGPANYAQAQSAGPDGAKPVKKKKKVWVPFVVIAVVLAILIGGGALYVKHFVDGPEKTVNRAVEALNNLDLRGLVGCCCPTIQNEYDGLLGLADSVLGLVGLDSGDLEAFAGLLPMLGLGDEIPHLDLEIKDVKYSGGFYESIPFKAEWLGKAFATDAYITVDAYENGQQVSPMTIHLRKYGTDGWLIETDLVM